MQNSMPRRRNHRGRIPQRTQSFGTPVVAAIARLDLMLTWFPVRIAYQHTWTIWTKVRILIEIPSQNDSDVTNDMTPNQGSWREKSLPETNARRQP